MKCWSHTAGKYGYRVTVYERKRRSNIWIKYWDKSKRKMVQKTLGHRHQKRAKAQAKEVVAALLAGTHSTAGESLTWAGLFGRYEQEVTAHKKAPQDAEDVRRIEMWQAVLGPHADPMQLDHPTLERFVRDRQHGRIVVAEHKLRPDPSAATVGADIIFLNSVLNWGTTVKLASKIYLLPRNPVKGYKRPKNLNPKRPIVSYDRYKRVLGKANEIDPQRLFRPFLVLMESLGWRVSALCAIKASDLDLKKTKTAPFGRIHKRGEMDKEGTDEWVPVPKETRAAIDVLRKRNPVIGDQYLFPAPKAKGKPWSRWHARDLLERAEAAAELDPVDGGDFHPYRRKWATERKNLPLTDVMAAGGWRDRRSLETSYMHADEATMYEVMAEPNKLREAR